MIFFIIRSTIYTTSLNPVDGDWHHLTVLWWESIKWALFIDGTFIDQEIQNYWNGIPHIPGGILRIGQIQHPINNPVGSFIGQITSFNMWDYSMSFAAISSLAESCISTPGNVFEWSTFKDKVHGELKLVKPSTCK